MICGHYGNVGVDLDLVLAGAVLHDIGKISELSYQRSFTYTTEGQLLGHIVIALRMLSEKIALVPDFPPKLRTLLEHMIVSHHGELEFGSPKVPLFPEALLLHHLDNLDSKMDCMRSAIARDRNIEGCWTAYNAPLDRAVLKKARYMEREPKGEAAARAAEPVVEADTIRDAAPAPAAAAPAAASPATPKSAAEKPTSFFAEKLKQAWRGH